MGSRRQDHTERCPVCVTEDVLEKSKPLLSVQERYKKFSMPMRDCSEWPNCRSSVGNCKVPGGDGLPVQCVGPWAENKYFFLERYIDATRAARKKYTDNGNSVFVDMFSGPGRCVVQNENREIAGGCLRVLNYDGTPFSEYHLADIEQDNIDALKTRLRDRHNCHFETQDANTLIPQLQKILLEKHYRYHFAYIDPFAPRALKWSTLEALAQLPRVDLLIHFPIGSIKRNVPQWLKQDRMTVLDEFLGTREWRDRPTELNGRHMPTILLNVLKRQLIAAGFPEKGGCCRRLTDDGNGD